MTFSNKKNIEQLVKIREINKPEQMIKVVLNNFPLASIRKRKNAVEKSVIFHMYRQRLLFSFNEMLKEEEDEKIKTVACEFDTAFCSIFFENEKFPNIKPLHTFLSDEEFYIILPFVINKIEFTSLIKDKLKEAVKFHSKTKLNFSRRTYLTNLYNMTYHFLGECFQQKKLNPFSEYKLACSTIKSSNFKDAVAFSKHRVLERLNANKIDEDKVKIYRGYSIQEDENVIINRKERIQDVNISISYSSTPIFACIFSSLNTKSEEEYDKENSMSVEYRVHKLKDYFNNVEERYLNKTNLKPVIATYCASLKDILYITVNPATFEQEVIMLNDAPNLIRYDFKLNLDKLHEKEKLIYEKLFLKESA